MQVSKLSFLNKWVTVSLACWITGLVASRAMVSIGMISLCLAAILHLFLLPTSFKPFFKNPSWWTPSLFFIVICTLVLYSGNTEYGSVLVRIKLPFLIIPPAVFILHNAIKIQFKKLLLYFAIIILITAIYSIIPFLINPNYYVELIQKGHHIPVPFSHVRFSLMLCLSSFIFLILAKDYDFGVKMLLTFLGFFSVFLLHILATRSGIAIFYLLMIFYSLWQIILNKSFKIGLLILSIITITPVIAYFTIPSFHARLHYMHYEYFKIKEEHVTFGSDIMRRYSIIGGWELFKEKPLTGHGGNMKEAMKEWYVNKIQLTDNAAQQLPHNQWIWLLACYGIIGTFTFALFFILSFFNFKWYKQLFETGVWILFSISFLVEPTLEEQIGTAFFLLFWSLLAANHYAD